MLTGSGERNDVVDGHAHAGHANLGTTSIYLQGFDPEEILATVHMRQAPMMSGSAGLRFSTTHGSGSVTALALRDGEARVRPERPR
jgi:hypothetical protein